MYLIVLILNYGLIAEVASVKGKGYYQRSRFKGGNDLAPPRLKPGGLRSDPYQGLGL